ncbi:hypothetical protein BDR22DRAFT_48975 [Usnea florida]
MTENPPPFHITICYTYLHCVQYSGNSQHSWRPFFLRRCSQRSNNLYPIANHNTSPSAHPQPLHPPRPSFPHQHYPNLRQHLHPRHRFHSPHLPQSSTHINFHTQGMSLPHAARSNPPPTGP